MTGIGRRHAGRLDKHFYCKVGFYLDPSNQFWLGRETSYTQKSLEYYRGLVEADRVEWEKKNKHSYKKMSNER